MDRHTPWVLAALASAFAAWSALAYREPGTAPAIAHAPPRAAAGKRVWLERNCQACHQIYGLGGYLGPDLTAVVPARGAAHVRRVLHEGFRGMPRFDLSGQEIEDLLIYLEYVGRSGRSPLKRWPTEGWQN